MEKVLKIFTTLFMMMLVFIMMISVIFRYVFNSPIAFAEESSRYILVWISFLGAGLAVKGDRHMRVDALITRLPDKLRSVLNLASNFLSVVFLAIGVYYGVQIIISAHSQVSDVLRINISYLYVAVVAGFIIMIYYLLKNTYYHIRRGQTFMLKKMGGKC